MRLQAAHNAYMLQAVAAVLAAANLGRVCGVDQRGIEVSLVA